MPLESAVLVDPAEALEAAGDLHTASEQLFFRGAHVAHVVAFEEFRRESRRQRAIDSARRYRRPFVPMMASFRG